MLRPPLQIHALHVRWGDCETELGEAAALLGDLVRLNRSPCRLALVVTGWGEGGVCPRCGCRGRIKIARRAL